MTIQDLLKLKESTYENWTEEEALRAVRRNSHNLQYVKNQTEEICMAAIEQNEAAIAYVAIIKNH